MHDCSWPLASCNSASGRQGHLRVLVLTILQTGRTQLYTIDWHYTLACLPAYLLKTHRRLLVWATTMHVRFVYERRRYAIMLKIRHGLATLNFNYSIVYGQKRKMWVFIYLVRTNETFRDQN